MEVLLCPVVRIGLQMLQFQSSPGPLQGSKLGLCQICRI